MSLLGQYKYITDKSHPRANADGSVYLHIIVAEKKLGRRLTQEEVVHHKDSNKLNNDPNNLMIFATKGDHTRFHMYDCDENMLSVNSDGVYICNQRPTICVDCGVKITKCGVRCKSCARKHNRKTRRPSKSELINILQDAKGNFTQIGKLYGVTDNAVRKWCDSYNLPRKSRDYK